MIAIAKSILLLLLVTNIDCIPIKRSSRKQTQRFLIGSSAEKCIEWYNKEPSPAIYLSKILKPPCQIPTSFPATLHGDWSMDPACDAKKQPDTCKFHKGAWGCYRHSYKTTGPGAQACYDKQGKWISDPWKGAGTLDAETPMGSLIQKAKHYFVDVVPFNNCCSTSDSSQPKTCNLYFEKRPPGQCEQKPAV